VLHLNDRARRRRNPRPEIGALLRNRTRDGAPLQLALRVANHPRVVFKVNDQALLASDRLALADNDGRENLLTQIRLTLLHSRHDHATRVRSRQTVLTATPALDCNEVQVLRARVIGAVDHGADRDTEGHLVLGTGGVTATCSRSQS